MTQTLRRNPGFYQNLWRLALPIVLQNIITTSLGFADTFMVGMLGNAEMAAVTAANTPIFIVQLVIFGFQSGMAVLVSQFWGRGDTQAINRCLGVALYTVTAFSAAVALICCVFPHRVLSLVTTNGELVALGRNYLCIVGFSYIFNGMSTVYVGVQRNTEHPGFGTALFTMSMGVNTLLNYIFIFGKLGAPALGVTGAAIATLLSRVVEFIVAAAYALRCKRIPLHPALLLRPGRFITGRFIKYSTPVVVNEGLWSLGVSMLTVIMGHMENSQDMLAAYALSGNVDKVTTVVCFGLGGAASVIVGKEIGMGRSKEQVQRTAGTLLRVSFLVGVVVTAVEMVLLPTFFKPVLFPLFDLTEGAAYAAGCMLTMYALCMPMRAVNITNIVGVLRSGGDIMAAFLIDVVPVWVISVPLMAVSGLVLDAPLWLACICVQAESVCKGPIGYLRYRSGKWINDITRQEV